MNGQPKIRLLLPDLPIVCPACGEEPRKGDWPITTNNNQLAVSCPACWAIVAPVVAVKAGN